jgi:hypothetical protein
MDPLITKIAISTLSAAYLAKEGHYILALPLAIPFMAAFLVTGGFGLLPVPSQ